MKRIELRCLGSYADKPHQRDLVYDSNGVSPCINGVGCEGGYNNQPRILIQYGSPIKF